MFYQLQVGIRKKKKKTYKQHKFNPEIQVASLLAVFQQQEERYFVSVGKSNKMTKTVSTFRLLCLVCRSQLKA